MPISKLRPTYTLIEDRLDQLKAVVPEAFADGKINWETLKEVLGEYLEDEDAPQAERFGLFWPGKREARRLANRPSTGTLVPQPGEGVDEGTTRNVFIEGDNLEVLKLLRKAYAGRIKMIYIDPPYNTGSDFVYRDDYAEPERSYLRRTGQADERGKLLTTNKKAGGRFHSNWLNMIYPRLLLARELLRDDGVIFVSIDDNEAHNLRLIMNEVFGEENFIGTIVWNSTKTVTNTALISVSHTYHLVFARSIDYFVKNRAHFRLPEPGDGFSNLDSDPRGPWKADPFQVGGIRPNQLYPITNPKTGRVYRPNPGCSWKNELRVFKQLLADNRIVFGRSGEAGPQRKRFLFEARERGRVAKTLWTDVDTTANATRELDALFSQRVFDNPKPVSLLQKLLRLGTHDADGVTVLDFFAGSCTTAQAVLDLNREDGGNRRFIMVQLPEPTPEGSTARNAGYETIAEIGKERIRRIIARMKEKGDSQLDLAPRETPEDLGFKCFRLARSRFKQWTGYQGESIAALQGQFDQFETPLVDGWQPEDLLVEILLQEGFPLDSAVERQKAFSQNAVYRVESEFCEHRLWVCLDGTIAQDTILRLSLADQDVFVCLDSALTDGSKLRLDDRCNVHVI